jgi:hypothetical protein
MCWIVNKTLEKSTRLRRVWLSPCYILAMLVAFRLNSHVQNVFCCFDVEDEIDKFMLKEVFDGATFVRSTSRDRMERDWRLGQDTPTDKQRYCYVKPTLWVNMEPVVEKKPPVKQREFWKRPSKRK